MQSILWRPTNILLHAKIILLRMQNILWRATNILQRPTNILLRMQSILRRAKSIRCRMHGSLSLKIVDLDKANYSTSVNYKIKPFSPQ